MPKTKLDIIKPLLGVTQLPDGDLLARLNFVHDGIWNNLSYPNPPVDITAFKAVIDALTAAAAAAANEGGKSTIVERDKYRKDAIVMFRLLGHYVEGTCKNDMTTFVSSGFAVDNGRQKNPPQPVSSPLILAVDQGVSGQLLISIKKVANARHYELRHAAVPAAGAMESWTIQTVGSTRPPAAVNNLTPGTIYSFQVRAFGKPGFSDWSAPAQRMCI